MESLRVTSTFLTYLIFLLGVPLLDLVLDPSPTEGRLRAGLEGTGSRLRGGITGLLRLLSFAVGVDRARGGLFSVGPFFGRGGATAIEEERDGLEELVVLDFLVALD